MTRKILAVILAVFMTFGTSLTAFATEPFDPVFYAKTYPDVVAALGTDSNALYNHYVNYGKAEGRIPYEGAASGENVSRIIGISEPVYQLTDLSAVRPAVSEEYSALYPTYDLSNWTPEQLALFEQKNKEFDASGFVHIGWTEEQVQEKLLSLKEVYPENTKVGICESGAGKLKTALYGNIQDYYIGVDKGGQPVYSLGYVFGWNRSKNNSTGRLDLKDIVRVGDRVRTSEGGTGHIFIVLSRDENGITVVESNLNWDEKMHWGRRIRWSELENIWYSMEHYLY